jgi:hypothetical protein
MPNKDSIERKKAVFRRNLRRDLKAAGYRIRLSGRSNWNVTPPSRSAQKRIMRRLRLEQIETERPFARKLEAKGILDLLGDSTIDLPKITPEIKICRTVADHELFRYAKLFQRVPTTNRVGRQLRCLVYDVGQQSKRLMGAFELTSGPYTMGARDAHLSWSGAGRKTTKDRGLRRLMDLATIIAIPPYNILLCGKLVAALAFSDVVVKEVRRRYRSEMLGVVATSATGLHCAILNRIGLRSGGLFSRIGQTSGYSTLGFSPKTLGAARAFLPGFVSAPEGEFSKSVRPIHVLRVAMRNCGIASTTILQSSYPKGVYLGFLDPADLDALRSGRARRARGVTIESILTYWRTTYLTKALASEHRQEALRGFVRSGPIASARGKRSRCSG